MKHTLCGRVHHFLSLMLVLVMQTGLVTAAAADAPAVTNTENWVNVSAAFTKPLGADDIQPGYLQRCIGMIVAPTGDIIMQTFKGVYISKDQGATWTMPADNQLTGRCCNEFSGSIAYPYDGRMAFFLLDGKVNEGGLSLDGGQTWKAFQKVAYLTPTNTSKNERGFEFADLDWNTHDPLTIFGLTHEPYFTVFSKDGGQSWTMPYKDKDETGKGDEAHYSMGVIDGNTIVRYKPDPPSSIPNQPGSAPTPPGGVIEMSTDFAQTWTQVSTNYQVLGRRPVHYGKNVYWTTAQGVITTANGKDWTLTGSGAEGACYGPFFGASEQEFVVVTNKNFLKTEDGGKTWKPIAKFYKAPDIFHNLPMFSYFGWDSTHNILYASGLAASVYQLKL